MTASPFTCVLDIKASLGECAIWSVEDQALWWVDINAPALNRFDPASGRNTAFPMPESIGCYAIRERGGFVLALRGGIWLADARGKLERKLVDASDIKALSRCDIVITAQGGDYTNEVFPKLRAAGWKPRWTNEEAFVAADRPGFLATITPKRRQELAPGVAGTVLVAGAVGAGVAIRRAIRRRRA